MYSLRTKEDEAEPVRKAEGEEKGPYRGNKDREEV